MLQNFFLVLIVVGLIGIVVIIGRHAPELAQLDLDELPTEKEQRRKKEILARRLNAESRRLAQSLRRLLKPLRKFWDFVQSKFRRYVYHIEKLWHHEHSLKSAARVAKGPAQREAILEFIKRGSDAWQQKSYEVAETNFIAAIKLDPKNAAAYQGLAETYVGRGSLEEAKQTYLFLLKLDSDNDQASAALGEIAEQQGNIEEAIQYFQQAALLNDSLSPRFYHLAELLLKINQPAVAREAIVSALALEPKNPKYLDLLLQTAILVNDKDEAERVFQELRLVNPDNQKLVEFRERIGKM